MGWLGWLGLPAHGAGLWVEAGRISNAGGWPGPGRAAQARKEAVRLLKRFNPEELKAVLVRWMEQEDPTPPQVIHADGKVIKNAEPAPARPAVLAAQAFEPCEIPEDLQKPKADKALSLVNFHPPPALDRPDRRAPGHQRGNRRGGPLAQDEFARSLSDDRCRPPHQSQLPPIDPKQRRGVPLGNA